MIIPIRCFSCGKLLADRYEEYNRLKAEGIKAKDIFKKLGITRFCCKRMLVSHVNLIDDLLEYNRLQ
jgi:DNA-directed RNA polymerase I, II, and III subunit RPABC5